MQSIIRVNIEFKLSKKKKSPLLFFFIGEIISWGMNNSGEKPILGLEKETVVAISPSYDTCMFVTIDNIVYFQRNT